jgi:hypothetical protein
MDTIDSLFERGKELAARLEPVVRQACGQGPLADAANPFHALVKALLSRPVAILEARYRAADERVRHLEKTEQWLRSEIERVGDLPAGSDVEELIGGVKAAVERVAGPVPPRLTIEDDLGAICQVLGADYEEALAVCAQVAACRSEEVEEAIRAGSSQEVVQALRQCLLAGVSFHHTCGQPDRVLAAILQTVLAACTPAAADVCQAPVAAPATPEVPAPCAAVPLYRFKLVGEIWSVAFGAEPEQFEDRRGMKEIAELLSRPNHRLEALELRGTPATRPSGGSVKTIATREAVREGLTVQASPGASRQDRTDDEGLHKVLARLVEVQEEIAEAGAGGCQSKLKELEEEDRKIRKWLHETTGHRLDGDATDARPGVLTRRLRRLGPAGPAMKAAESLRKAIARVKQVLQKTMPGLVKHFDEYLRQEGSTFAYYPPEHQPKWDV